MSLSDLASLGSFVSGVAVLVSLVFLYFQLRQLSRQGRQAEKNQRALMQQARAARVVDIGLRLAGPDLGSLYAKGVAGGDLSYAEFHRFRLLTRAITANFEDSFYQHEDGLLADAAFETAARNQKVGMAAPGRRAMWGLERPQYEPGFRAYIDAWIAEDAPPRGDELAEWRAALVKPAEA
jgi:hypothetical protein